MQTVIDVDVTVGLDAPVLDTIHQRPPATLQREIHHRGRPTRQGGGAAGREVVDAALSHKADEEMRVHVDTARQHELAGRHRSRGWPWRAAPGGSIARIVLSRDEDIGGCDTRRRHHIPANNGDVYAAHGFDFISASPARR
ncbi:MAG: hypothetical protein WDO24_10000 [Pseudomonadota bacterium]